MANIHGKIEAPEFSLSSASRTSGSCWVKVYLLLSLTLPTYENAGPASENCRTHRALVTKGRDRRRDDETGIMVAPTNDLMTLKQKSARADLWLYDKNDLMIFLTFERRYFGHHTLVIKYAICRARYEMKRHTISFYMCMHSRKVHSKEHNNTFLVSLLSIKHTV